MEKEDGGRSAILKINSIIFTLREFCLDWIVIDLQRRIGIWTGKTDHMVPAIIDLFANVTNGYILGAQVVVQEQFSSILTKKQQQRLKIMDN